MADLVDLSKLKLAELRTICKENGLPVTGNKGDIIQRIEEFYEKDEDDLLGESLNEDDLLNDDSTINEEDVLGSLELEGTDESAKPSKPTVKRPIQPEAGRSEEPPTKRAITAVHLESKDSLTKEPSSTETKVQPDKDKKLSRAERFGIPTAETVTEKKKTRAERFGIPTFASIEDKKVARADRFGLSKSTNDSSDEKKHARAERFGLSTSAQPEIGSKLASRAERFGLKNSSASDSSKVEILKKRQERFGESVSPVLSQVEEKSLREDTGEADKSKFSANHISFGNSEKKDDRAKRFGIAVK